MEEAFKMRNLLQEFLKQHDGPRMPTILGLREHIFTGRYDLLYQYQFTWYHFLYKLKSISACCLSLSTFCFLQCFIPCMVYVQSRA